MAKSKVLFETITQKGRLIEKLDTKRYKSLAVIYTDLLNELIESSNIVSHVRFKLQMFVEAKSTDEVGRLGNDFRSGVRLPKFRI